MLRNVDAEAKITLDLENSTTYEVKLYAGMYDSNNSQSVHHLGSFLIENTNSLNVSSNYTIDSVLAYIREISIDRVILSVKSLKFEDVTNLLPTYILYNRRKYKFINIKFCLFCLKKEIIIYFFYKIQEFFVNDNLLKRLNRNMAIFYRI